MKAKNLVLCGLFAALLSLCAWIYIPVGGIGFTLQSFAVCMILGLLGGKWGTVCLCVYLILGIAGLPVFSGFRGGMGVLLGATGGYLLSFPLQGVVYWLLTGCLGTGRRVRLWALIAGQVLCYAVGTVWFGVVYAAGNAGLGAILLQCVVPYLAPDIFKLFLAFTLTEKLKPFL